MIFIFVLINVKPSGHCFQILVLGLIFAFKILALKQKLGHAMQQRALLSFQGLF